MCPIVFNSRLTGWHPLLTGSREAIQAAGIAVTGKVLDERYVHPDDYQDQIIHWVEQ